MDKRYILIAAFGALLSGCGNDSGGGISRDECGCLDGQVCVNNKCYAEGSACAKCGEGQVCVNDACHDANDPCLKCNEDQVCGKDGKCYERGDACSQCDKGEVCKNQKCYAADSPCLACDGSQICEDGECKTPSDPCDLCSPSDTCEGGECIPCPYTVCGTNCCGEGEVCSASGDFCTFECEDGRPACDDLSCCAEDMFCSEAGYCDRKCEFGTSCGEERVCCGEDQACLNDSYCAPKCDSPRVLCGTEKNEVCCAEGMVCFQNACHNDCSANTTRCGVDQNLCCDDASEICIFNKCLKKGKACQKNDDCELWEFCDVEGSKTCVSQDENTAQCVYVPKIEKFEPVIKWHYSEAPVEGTPAVADMTGDGVPDVVFENENSELVVLDGDTGEVLAKSRTRAWHPWGDLALADVDNDNVVEALVSTGEIGAGKSGLGVLSLVNAGGKWEWKEEGFLKIDDNLLAGNLSDGRYYADIHPSVADIDGDTIPEIVTAVGVAKGNDLSKWQCTLNLPSYGAWYRYGIVVADLDQDGQSELIADKIYNNKCQVLAENSESGWGFPAVADTIPNNNEPGELVPEIIRVGNDRVSAWKVYKNGTTWSQKKIWSTPHPGGGGGHPNISDFDGDKKAEIGIAGADYYAVFKGDTGAVLWQSKTQDHSSRRTGSSVFDFEGDGKAEVVYRDECYLRVYNGTDGNIIMEEPVTSGTVIDYPIIVDVDADGKTEIITTSASHPCTFADGKKPVGQGVIAYEDSHSKWVRTRKIWNQHAYHVTNINENGTVPKPESANWLNKRLNNYRANTQPDDAFNAPNLKAGDLKAEQNCPKYKLTATVKNEGSASAKNVWVSFYIRGYEAGNGKDDLLIGSVQAKGTIAPGASMDVSYSWDLSGKLVKSGQTVEKVVLPQQISFSVDDAPGKNTADFYNECIEDDNDSKAVPVEACPVM